MWHDTNKIVSEPRTVPRCFSLYHLDHGHNSSKTSCDPWPPGQLGAGRLPHRRVCICVAHGKHCRFWSETSCYLSCRKIFSRVVLGRPEPGLPPCSNRNSSRYGPLLSLISPPRPLFCSADLPNLLEHPPKRTTFYMLISQRKATKCVQSPFCGICGGIPGFTQNHQKLGRRTSVRDLRSPKLPSGQRYIHDYALLRLEYVVCGQQRSRTLKLLIPKLYFEAKPPVFTPFLYRSTDQTFFLML